jgi:hypothetical protein
MQKKNQHQQQHCINPSAKPEPNNPIPKPPQATEARGKMQIQKNSNSAPKTNSTSNKAEITFCRTLAQTNQKSQTRIL